MRALGLMLLVGLGSGILVEGLVSSYHYSRSMRPWPRCRRCGHVAPLVLLVPLLGVLAYPRCARCHLSHAARTVLVEGATALAVVVTALVYRSEPDLVVVSTLETTLLVAVLFIDVEVRLIPTALIAGVLVLAISSAAARPGLGLENTLLGAGLAFALFGFLVMLARIAWGAGALGLGDASLACAIGGITGYPLVLLALEAGILLGGLAAVVALLVGRTTLRGTLPYGPPLIIAALVVCALGKVFPALL